MNPLSMADAQLMKAFGGDLEAVVSALGYMGELPRC